MFNFFDYVHYSICSYYGKYEKTAETSGILILSLMYSFNLLSVFWLFEAFLHKKFPIGKLSIIILFIILLILNGIRYNKLNYDILKEKWKADNTETQTRKGAQVLTYIILSTAVFIGLAIYLGSKKW